MKRLSALAVLGLICACVTAQGEDQLKDAPVAHTGSIKEGFQLSAQVEKATFRPQEAIKVSVLVKNTTASTRMFDEAIKPVSGKPWPERTIKLVVKNSGGKTAALTAYGKSVFDKAILPPGTQQNLEAGQEITRTLLVNRLFDMTLSGTYTITAERHVFSQDGKRWPRLVSNSVQVTIAEE